MNFIYFVLNAENSRFLLKVTFITLPEMVIVNRRRATLWHPIDGSISDAEAVLAMEIPKLASCGAILQESSELFVAQWPSILNFVEQYKIIADSFEI